MRIVHVAAAALLDGRGRVLLARRPEGKPMAGLWEFPGGKIEPGETPEAALARELEEELGVVIGTPVPLAFVSHGYEGFHLVMLLYAVREWVGALQGLQGQALDWVDADRLDSLPMPAADVPLLAPVRAAM
jgi:8-oxo-dGTP diphosphatase